MLEVAQVGSGGRVRWEKVPDPTTVETETPTRLQVPSATRFDGSEGIWHARGVCYFTTKGDRKVWAYDIRERRLEILYDRAKARGSSLDAVDNVTVNALGDVFVCEDGGNLEIGLISKERTVSPFLRLPGSEHTKSELCGVCFDPSGNRMYFTSQRAGLPGAAAGGGAIYEVSGPFRLPKGGQPSDFIFGPPAGEDRPAGPLNPRPDPAGPELRVRAPRRISLRRLLRRGLKVRVSTSEPARLALGLRTPGLGSVSRADGSTPRPRSVRLAKLALGDARSEAGGGPVRIKLGLRPRAKKRLRRRIARRREPVPARLITVAVDANGRRVSEVRKLKIRPPG